MPVGTYVRLIFIYIALSLFMYVLRSFCSCVLFFFMFFLFFLPFFFSLFTYLLFRSFVIVFIIYRVRYLSV